MKKIYLGLLALACSVQLSHAQWSGGSDIYNTNTGNVGIGTTTPGVKLDINGIIRTNTLLNTNIPAGGNGLNVTNGTDADCLISISGAGAGLKFAKIESSVPNTPFSINPTNGGNVGIGTITPNANLEIKALNVFDGRSSLRVTNNSSDFGRTTLILTGRLQQGNDAWAFGNSARNAIVFSVNESVSGQNIGAIGDERYSIQLEQNSNSIGFLSKQNGQVPNMVINQAGYVGVGTTSPDSRLSVNGTIHSKEVKVDLLGWPDYVFKPKYNLASLREVKTYIDQNHHLPDMPSEQQVAKEGLNLGDMNAKLLRKVEELTLYLIEKDKQLAEQNKKLKQQEARLTALESRLNKQRYVGK